MNGHDAFGVAHALHADLWQKNRIHATVPREGQGGLFVPVSLNL